MNQPLSQLECPQDAESQFFFLHTPKTAGTTLIRIIELQFGENEIARWLYPFRLIDSPESFFRQHRYFHGHVEYAVMCSFLSKPPVTLTMLREPVARYLSHFSNHQRVRFDQIPDITFEEFTQFQQTSLADFVQQPPGILVPLSRYFQNLHARMLASEPHSDPAESRQVMRHLIESGYALSPPTLEQAQQRLDQLAFVGITEQFQKSLFLMAYTCGWPPVVDYESVNMAPHQLSRADISPDLVEQLLTLNQLDRWVYEYGKRLFERRYEQMCEELLERYGRREHAHLKLPLQTEVMVELLDAHYRLRFVERYPPVSAPRIGFDQAIPGRNWHTTQPDEVHGTFRWTGPGSYSTIHLPLAATSDVWLRFSVIRTISEELLKNLVVKVNGEQILVGQHRLENGATIYQGYVPKSVLAQFPGCVQVGFELAKTLIPVDVVPGGSQDDRPLGIALTWVEVEPARPMGRM